MPGGGNQDAVLASAAAGARTIWAVGYYGIGQLAPGTPLLRWNGPHWLRS